MHVVVRIERKGGWERVEQMEGEVWSSLVSLFVAQRGNQYLHVILISVVVGVNVLAVVAKAEGLHLAPVDLVVLVGVCLGGMGVVFAGKGTRGHAHQDSESEVALHDVARVW